MKKHFVTVVDYGETCDGRSRIIGVFDTREEAVKFVREDIDSWCQIRLENGFDKDDLNIDYDKMRVYANSKGGDLIPVVALESCFWNIEELVL